MTIVHLWFPLGGTQRERDQDKQERRAVVWIKITSRRKRVLWRLSAELWDSRHTFQPEQLTPAESPSSWFWTLPDWPTGPLTNIRLPLVWLSSNGAPHTHTTNLWSVSLKAAPEGPGGGQSEIRLALFQLQQHSFLKCCFSRNITEENGWIVHLDLVSTPEGSEPIRLEDKYSKFCEETR